MAEKKGRKRGRREGAEEGVCLSILSQSLFSLLNLPCCRASGSEVGKKREKKGGVSRVTKFVFLYLL